MLTGRQISPSLRNNLRGLGVLTAWGILPLLIGVLLAQVVAPRPVVGLIRLETDIWSSSANLILAQIEETRLDPRIRAVVVQIDSPGGEVVATQTLFLEMQNLRKRMPVVSSIDGIAASGAYYLAMATDPIYAKPSSTVGNVGVWGFAPPEVGITDALLASGPFKLTASNRTEFIRLIDSIKQEFVATVFNARGDRLKISTADLAQGLAYPGRDALNLGLIDHLGTLTDALNEAAYRAGVYNYEVVDLQARAIARLYGSTPFLLEPWFGAAEPLTGRRTLPPGVYLLYDTRLGGAP